MKGIRFDVGVVNHVDRSEEGFLTIRGTATRTGVFEYRNRNGSKRLELRHPDDVLDPKSLKTLGAKPTTLEHPPDLVDPTTFGTYGVGSGNNTVEVVHDGLIDIVFNVYRADAIQAIESGEKRQLSCGYRCDVIEESGVYKGQSYTHRQKNIRYNHVAIVGRGRAGAIAQLHMDGADGEGVNRFDVAYQDSDCDAFFESVNTGGNTDQGDRPMASIRIDGAEFEGLSETVAALVGGKLKALEDATTQISSLQTQLGTYTTRLDELNGELTEAKQERDREAGRAFKLEADLEDLQFRLDELEDEMGDDDDDDDDECDDEEGGCPDKKAKKGAKGKGTKTVATDSEALETRVDSLVQERLTGLLGAISDANSVVKSLTDAGIEVPEIKFDAVHSPADVQRTLVVALNPGVEFTDQEIPGFYKALKTSSFVRKDSGTSYHADVLETVVTATKSKKRADRSDRTKTRMDNCKKPLAMTKQ